MKKKTEMEKAIERILNVNGIEQYVLAYQTVKKSDEITVGGTRDEGFELYLHLYLMRRLITNAKIKG